MPTLQLPLMVTSLGELELENAIQLRIFRNQIATLELPRHSPYFAPMWIREL